MFLGNFVEMKVNMDFFTLSVFDELFKGVCVCVCVCVCVVCIFI